jgi:hypothetical protein
VALVVEVVHHLGQLLEHWEAMVDAVVEASYS